MAERDCNILDSQQYGSPRTSTFFLRVHVDSPVVATELREQVAGVADAFGMTWQLHADGEQQRVLVLVSRMGHCLNDLLYRWRSGYLPGAVAAVASNHADLQSLTASYDVPFHHLPVNGETRGEQESQILALVDSLGVDLVVLARYMQVLSARVCDALPGRIINI